MTLDEAIEHAKQQAEEEIHSYKETLKAIKTFTHSEGK